jgi:hypothetical protein
MKAIKSPLVASLAIAISLFATDFAAAQTVVKETVITNSSGTISEFNPDTIFVRSETSASPVRYYYTDTTTYVDETGAPVTVKTVKSGLPVTVYYTKVGDRMIASKVVVRKAVSAPVEETTTKTTTTTTK